MLLYFYFLSEVVGNTIHQAHCDTIKMESLEEKISVFLFLGFQEKHVCHLFPFCNVQAFLQQQVWGNRKDVRRISSHPVGIHHQTHFDLHILIRTETLFPWWTAAVKVFGDFRKLLTQRTCKDRNRFLVDIPDIHPVVKHRVLLMHMKEQPSQDQTYSAGWNKEKFWLTLLDSFKLCSFIHSFNHSNIHSPLHFCMVWLGSIQFKSKSINNNTNWLKVHYRTLKDRERTTRAL